MASRLIGTSFGAAGSLAAGVAGVLDLGGGSCSAEARTTRGAASGNATGTGTCAQPQAANGKPNHNQRRGRGRRRGVLGKMRKEGRETRFMTGPQTRSDR